MKTDIKCKGCEKDIPIDHYDNNTGKPTWFGIFKNNDILDWVCIDCWHKGIRYEGYVAQGK